VFDRCDTATTTIFDTALAEARRHRHGWFGTEHVLIAIVTHRALFPDEIAAVLRADPDTVRVAMIADLEPRPESDAELLAVVGINLDEVRSAVTHTFGAETIEQLGRHRVHQPWQPWRRPTRRCTSLLASTITVAPRLKQALQHANTWADRHSRTQIDPVAVLHGMLAVHDSMANRLLRHVGVDPVDLEQRIATVET